MNRLKNSTEVSGVHPEVSEFLFFPETSVYLPEISGKKYFEMVVKNPGYLATETLGSTKKKLKFLPKIRKSGIREIIRSFGLKIIFVK
jgi:hypothetical protein